MSSLNAIPLAFGTGSKIVSNVYHVIWKAIYALASDPHPRISTDAQTIIDEIRSRSFSGLSNESLRESKSNSSISESSSPNTAATFSISDSPPSTTIATYSITRRIASEITSTLSTVLTNSSINVSPSQRVSIAPHDMRRDNNSNQHMNHNTTNVAPQPPPPPPPMPNVAHTAASTPSSGTGSNYTSNNSNSQVPNIERITKSANVAIGKARRYASSKDNNMSEDDARSNISSQKPLVSTDFVDWCTKYFVEPENQCAPVRLANGKEDQQREWRMLRVLSYRNVCLRELMVIDPSRLNENLSNYKVPQVPNLVAVHPYDPIMVIAGRDEFSIMHLDGPHVNNYTHSYDSALSSSISSASLAAQNSILLGSGQNSHHAMNHHNSYHPHHQHYNHHSSSNLVGSNNNSNSNSNSIINNNSNNMNDGHHHTSHDLIGTLSNHHSSTSQITSLQLINPEYNTLICTGSSEGSVRIWRAYNGIDYSFKPQLLTAFHLMPELHPQRQGLGMILLWDQHQSKFYATSDQNDVRMIKVWDATSESKVQDIPTCAEFGVSCLSSDGEHSIAAGFLDGSIRIYDTRLKKTDCRTFTFRKHSEKILTLHMFKPGEKHINLVSGDSGGEVRFWDKRAPTSVKRVEVGQKMSVMSVHPNADVFAW